jgi:hypothetical protein
MDHLVYDLWILRVSRHIPEDGISLVEFFGGISSGLSVVLQSNNNVHQYYYVEKDL